LVTDPSRPNSRYSRDEGRDDKQQTQLATLSNEKLEALGEATTTARFCRVVDRMAAGQDPYGSSDEDVDHLSSTVDEILQSRRDLRDPTFLYATRLVRLERNNNEGEICHRAMQEYDHFNPGGWLHARQRRRLTATARLTAQVAERMADVNGLQTLGPATRKLMHIIASMTAAIDGDWTLAEAHSILSRNKWTIAKTLQRFQAKQGGWDHLKNYYSKLHRARIRLRSDLWVATMKACVAVATHESSPLSLDAETGINERTVTLFSAIKEINTAIGPASKRHAVQAIRWAFIGRWPEAERKATRSNESMDTMADAIAAGAEQWWTHPPSHQGNDDIDSIASAMHINPGTTEIHFLEEHPDSMREEIYEMLERAIIRKAFDRATSDPTREEYNVDGTVRIRAHSTPYPTLYQAVRMRALEKRATIPDHYNWRHRRIHHNIVITQEEIDNRRRQVQARIEEEARVNTRRRQPAKHYNGITNHPTRGLLTPTASTPGSPTPFSPASPQYIDLLTHDIGANTPPASEPPQSTQPWEQEALLHITRSRAMARQNTGDQPYDLRETRRSWTA